VSGTGKSSLIHCGLANKFRETDWLPLVIRRGANIIGSMSEGIKSASITKQENKFASPGDFKKGVRSLYLDHYKPVFFIFDQFEELFIFGGKDERREFIHIVKSLIDSDLQCRLIFIMREEYMAWITEFEKVIPSFFANRIRIEKMSHRNALDAIKEPCKVFNINTEEGFAETLLEKLSPGSTEVELTFLQVYLDKIFRLAQSEIKSVKEDEKITFTLSLLQKTGNVSDLLGSFLDDQISLMDNPDTAMTVLKAFVSDKGTKRPANESETIDNVRSLGKELSQKQITELLQIFVNLRVLRDKDDHGRYELRHDALAIKIFEKFTLTEKELLEVRKFVENAYSNFENRGVFLSKDDLEYLSSYENKLTLPDHLKNFLDESHRKIQFRKRAFKRISTLSALVFILIVAAILRSYLLGQSSTKEREQIGSMLLKYESDPVKLINTSYTIWEKYSLSSVLQRIILKNFQKLLMVNTDSSTSLFQLQEHFKPIFLSSPVIKAEISPGGENIIGWLENQTVFILNIHSGKLNQIKTNCEIVNIEVSERDSLLAVVFTDNSVKIYNLFGNLQYSLQTTLNEVFNERLVSFFPSGENLLAVVNNNGVDIYSGTGEKKFELNRHNGKINSVDISPDGRFIVTVSDDKKGFIWNFNKEVNKYSVYDSLIGHNDTVWSCAFNKTSKFIITTSADSSVRIWNLGGKQLNPDFRFAWNYQNTPRYKSKFGEYDEDINDPNLSVYYRKNCNAYFSADEMGIVVSGYTYSFDSIRNKKIDYNQILYFDSKGKFYTHYWTEFSGIIQTENVDILPEEYNQLVLSPSGDRAAVANNRDTRIDLLSPEGLRIITLDGKNPIFSKNGKELYWVKSNQILKISIDPQEIVDILHKYKIPESIKSGESNLMVI
jgi:WD40 repeat protein